MDEETKKLKDQPPIVIFVGNSNAGKTTFVEKLIPALRGLGLKVGTIKHDVHGFEMDIPGKDSWRHKQAGAYKTLISSPHQIGMIQDVSHDHLPGELLSFHQGVDLVLCEGFKREPFPKIEVMRAALGKPLICSDDPNLVAVVSDMSLDIAVPCLPIDSGLETARFLYDFFQFSPIKIDKTHSRNFGHAC